MGVEIDGGIHNERQQKVYDEIRTDRLDMLDIKVIRYTNNQVINNIDLVKQDIIKKIKIRKVELIK